MDSDLTLPLWLPLLVAAPFIGSFLGTLILRLPADRPVLLARSECDHCHATLGARDLVPLASWLWLRGKCRHCGVSIGAFAPLIELAAMGVIAWAATQTQGAVLVASCVLGWLLLTLAAIDWRAYILPDALTLILAIEGLIATWFLDPGGLLDRVIAMAAGFAIFAALAMLYRRIRGRDGMGLGDAKLLGALGAWVSWQGLPTVVLVGAVTGLAVALAMSLKAQSGEVRSGSPDKLRDKQRARTLSAATRIPFGAFLALGGWIVWLYGPIMFSP